MFLYGRKPVIILSDLTNIETIKSLKEKQKREIERKKMANKDDGKKKTRLLEFDGPKIGPKSSVNEMLSPDKYNRMYHGITKNRTNDVDIVPDTQAGPCSSGLPKGRIGIDNTRSQKSCKPEKNANPTQKSKIGHSSSSLPKKTIGSQINKTKDSQQSASSINWKRGGVKSKNEETDSARSLHGQNSANSVSTQQSGSSINWKVGSVKSKTEEIHTARSLHVQKFGSVASTQQSSSSINWKTGGVASKKEEIDTTRSLHGQRLENDSRIEEKSSCAIFGSETNNQTVSDDFSSDGDMKIYEDILENITQRNKDNEWDDSSDSVILEPADAKNDEQLVLEHDKPKIDDSNVGVSDGHVSETNKLVSGNAPDDIGKNNVVEETSLTRKLTFEPMEEDDCEELNSGEVISPGSKNGDRSFQCAEFVGDADKEGERDGFSPLKENNSIEEEGEANDDVRRLSQELDRVQVDRDLDHVSESENDGNENDHQEDSAVGLVRDCHNGLDDNEDGESGHAFDMNDRAGKTGRFDRGKQSKYGRDQNDSKNL